jgi:outer membrane protein W
MKKIIIILFISLLLGQNIFAQSNFSILLGGGYIFSSNDKEKLPYWENGYLFSFSAENKLTDRISFLFSLSYQKYFFDKNLITSSAPQVIGFNYTLNGENSEIYGISLGSRFYASISNIKPYLGIGLGLAFLNQGKVELTNWIDVAANKTTSSYVNSGNNYSISQFNVDIGVEINLINNFQFLLEGKMVNNFDGFYYFPITTSVKFGL